MADGQVKNSGQDHYLEPDPETQLNGDYYSCVIKILILDFFIYSEMYMKEGGRGIQMF